MNYRTIYHSDKQEIVDLFVGKSVKKALGFDDMLILSDGTHLQIIGNDGCGGCPSGYYWLEELNEVDNIITNVEVEVNEISKNDYDPYSESDTTYSIFVYSGHQKINLATIQGSDGNGYYGTGFWIKVMKP